MEILNIIELPKEVIEASETIHQWLRSSQNVKPSDKWSIGHIASRSYLESLEEEVDRLESKIELLQQQINNNQ